MALSANDDHFDPRKGGPGYPEWFRERIMLMARKDALEHVSASTLDRWIEQQQQIGTVTRIPHEKGCHRRISAIEVAVMHLIKLRNPTASADEVMNAIASLFGRVFSRPKITLALKDYNPYGTLNFVCTESDAVDASEFLRALWRLQPPPLGHVGVNRYDLIDHDECGLFVTTCNRHYGHAYMGKRATEVQQYIKGVKFTLVMGISAQGEVSFSEIHSIPPITFQ